MRVLESMRVSMPDVAALQRMDQLRNGGRRWSACCAIHGISSMRGLVN
jgi:hypothetical protein